MKAKLKHICFFVLAFGLSTTGMVLALGTTDHQTKLVGSGLVIASIIPMIFYARSDYYPPKINKTE